MIHCFIEDLQGISVISSSYNSSLCFLCYMELGIYLPKLFYPRNFSENLSLCAFANEGFHKEYFIVYSYRFKLQFLFEFISFFITEHFWNVILILIHLYTAILLTIVLSGMIYIIYNIGWFFKFINKLLLTHIKSDTPTQQHNKFYI